MMLMELIAFNDEEDDDVDVEEKEDDEVEEADRSQETDHLVRACSGAMRMDISQAPIWHQHLQAK